MKQIDQLKAGGQTKILGAPFFPYDGASMLIETDDNRDRASIEQFVESDPYVKNKLVSKWSVKEFDGATIECKRKFDRVA